ncbi:hypothetical protein MKW94_018113 [Papaver nudicaule]|uniref:J domain-containing protein n=1 Tax=Papaver nudicaule TaxID=74823 RepID=A0AA41SNH3_PAPNU|nr:hypothetical protein [Papaver nudicaule]
MIRSSATRLAYSLVRRSLDYQLLYSLRQGTPRGFVSSSCNSYKNLGYRDLEYARFTAGGLQNSVLLGCMGSTRKIHGTGFACRDYYDMLGVSKKATASEIKKAYHGLAKKLHPDTNKDDADAGKKFQEVQKAYEVLIDNEKRSYYDQVGHHAFDKNPDPPAPPGRFDSIKEFVLSKLFGSQDEFEKIMEFVLSKLFGGQDVNVVYELSFMEAVWGCSKACGGTGVPPWTWPETCQTCRGSGTTGPIWLPSKCTSCRGTGRKSFCKSCMGDRVVEGPKTVNVDFMPGIDNNETIKIPKSGGVKPGRNHPGDLYVKINVGKHPIFRREGLDIHVDAVVSATQAILGATVQVPTLNGDVVLKVSPGTQPGHKVIMKRKGIKTINPASVGNQYVHFNISIPTNLTQRERQLIEEFAKGRGEDYYMVDSDSALAG